jgi:hypothetical protein
MTSSRILNSLAAAVIVAALAFTIKPLQAAAEVEAKCSPGGSTCCQCTTNTSGNVTGCAKIAANANYECRTGTPGYCSEQICYVW